MLELLYPPRCIFCNNIIPINEYKKLDICISCFGKIPWIKEPACSKCGRAIANTGLCTDCKKIEHSYVKGWIALEYDDMVKSAIYRFKYGNSPRAAKAFSEMMYRAIKDKNIEQIKFDFIVPVPIHKNRLNKRGYNQSELLAKALSKKMNIPYKNMLKRVKDTKPQSGLSPRQRVNNISGAFKVTKTRKSQNKNILVIDYIYTTGATIDACAYSIIDTIGQNAIYYYILTSVNN
jgi:ComF family protein